MNPVPMPRPTAASEGRRSRSMRSAIIPKRLRSMCGPSARREELGRSSAPSHSRLISAPPTRYIVPSGFSPITDSSTWYQPKAGSWGIHSWGRPAGGEGGVDVVDDPIVHVADDDVPVEALPHEVADEDLHDGARREPARCWRPRRW